MNKPTIFLIGLSLGIIVMLSSLWVLKPEPELITFPEIPAVGGPLIETKIGDLEVSNLTKDFIRGDTLATTTIDVSFEYQGETLSVSVGMDGYNNCRAGIFGQSDELFCKNFLRQQVNDNIKWAKEAVDARLDTPADYSLEISNKDL